MQPSHHVAVQVAVQQQAALRLALSSAGKLSTAKLPPLWGPVALLLTALAVQALAGSRCQAHQAVRQQLLQDAPALQQQHRYINGQQQ
jgi:hypothetical protein